MSNAHKDSTRCCAVPLPLLVLQLQAATLCVMATPWAKPWLHLWHANNYSAVDSAVALGTGSFRQLLHMRSKGPGGNRHHGSHPQPSLGLQIAR